MSANVDIAPFPACPGADALSGDLSAETDLLLDKEADLDPASATGGGGDDTDVTDGVVNPGIPELVDSDVLGLVDPPFILVTIDFHTSFPGSTTKFGPSLILVMGAFVTLQRWHLHIF